MAENQFPKKRAYLCEKHFHKNQFKDPFRYSLLRGAIPSRDAWYLYSGTTDITPSFELPSSPTSPVLPTLSTSPPNLTASFISPSDLPPPSPSPPDPALPATSTPKPFQPIQLFAPSPDVSHFSESNSDCLATPLEIYGSMSDSVVADIAVDSFATTPIAKRKRRSLVLSKINVSRISQLTPRKKFLFGRLKDKVVDLQRLQKKYRKKTLALKRLSNDMKNGHSSVVGALSKSMSLTAAKLLASQVGHSQRAPKGHRWSTEEKCMALSIYKRSPKCYTFLRSIFTLPCKSTLMNLLNRVPFATGINSQIFESLAKSVSELAPPDRICSLMFDDMAIMEHIQYDPRSDRILGYEDLGGCAQPSKKVANQVLVFMAKGLRRKWKQPVGYYFHRGGMCGSSLAMLLREVLQACREAGLIIVTTVCDMGGNNVRALQDMGASFEKPFFTFNNQEVVTIYDPPHLLKCTRNMLYKHDVQLNVKNSNGTLRVLTASWDHIREAVKLDRKEPYQALYKITNDHLDPNAFKKMKVSLAAQVMSNKMAANLHAQAVKGEYHIQFQINKI